MVRLLIFNVDLYFFKINLDILYIYITIRNIIFLSLSSILLDIFTMDPGAIIQPQLGSPDTFHPGAAAACVRSHSGQRRTATDLVVPQFLKWLSWFITPITMVYGTYHYSYWGESKPTYNWGPSHCIYIYIYGLTMVTVIMVHNADLMGLIQGCAPVC